MKKLEFKTSKGEFIIVESVGRRDYYEAMREEFPNGRLKNLGFVKHMTLDQYSKVLDQSRYTGLFAHYVRDVSPVNIYCYNTGEPSLESIINYKGYHLYDNTIQTIERSGALLDDNRYNRMLEIENSLTFINPLLFKRV